ncbi:MAG: glycine--tRNA ligase subunit beta [Burkholderiales bacterium]|nr:glycine--tRNA ligase subunit beta [Burkholderiales bacterium]
MQNAIETLLVELHTEELPPKALKGLGEAFAAALADGLRTRDFLSDASTVTSFATPRRLAVAVSDVRGFAPDKPFKEKLLPTSIAFDKEGNPTPALLGKLKARQLAHVDPASLTRETDGKTEALYYCDVAKGGPLRNGLQAALDDALEKLPIPKVMSYAAPGSYYNDEKFVRPAHRLVALHGSDVVPVTALGLTAGRTTRGHRFLSRGAVDIATAQAYAPTLEAEGKVVPSFAARRATIVVGLEGAAGDATPIMPEALLDEVTALTEWPVVYAGSFDSAFLAVPQECLILTMQLNQRYFALADDAGKLVNRFLVVGNLATADPSAIVAGNERVLRARLADAKFFFDQDRKLTLESRLPKLEAVVYHNKLGTQAERVDRLRFLAQRIAPLIGADAAHAVRAAQLAKADLVADMVGEFPELQGVMGRYYATHDGEALEVAAAIEQHYWPKAAGGPLPETPVAQAVALADKLEAMAGLFGIGQVPTGDKDPFGLRRAALGVVRILIERRHAVSLAALVALAFDAFGSVAAVQPSAEALLDFVYDRLRGYLRDQGYTANQVAAVLDARPDTVADLPARLAAVQAFIGLPEAAALSAANKRIVNILRKSGSEAAAAVDRARLADGAEHDLYLMFQRLSPQVEADFGKGEFEGALRALAAAKPAVDRYFDDVMVMDDDPAVRANRLAFLRGVAHTMNRVADIGKLAQ